MTNNTSQLMLGTIIPWAGTTIPSGWMLCSGQLLSVTQYVALFSLIGNNFGGDGRTTFALPNFPGRFLGAVSSNRFGQGGSSSFYAGLSCFPSGTTHTHTLAVSFPDNQTSFSTLTNFQYMMPIDTVGSQTATPSANTILGVGQVQTSPTATPAKIYGAGTPVSGNMCSRTIPVTIDVTLQPSWTASVPHMYPPGTGLPASFIPPYCALNFIICVQGTKPSCTLSDDEDTTEERGE